MHPRPFRLSLIALLFLCAVSPVASATAPGASAPAACPGGRVALTFDDLPWGDPKLPAAEALAATERLLAVLAAHQAPATGFVVCDRIGGREAILDRWRAAGMGLGNHSASHRDLDHADLATWQGDVRSCHERLARWSDRPLFRFPYLHQGATRERHDAAAALLAELGSPIAHVSVDTSEWILADRYRKALAAGDEAKADRVRRLFTPHVVAAIDHFREVARERVGRDIDHVLLLHATRLVADRLDELLDALDARGTCFVPLADALADPVYAREDGYLGAKGLSWLYRIAPATPRDVAWDDREASLLVDALARREPEKAAEPEVPAGEGPPLALGNTEVRRLHSERVGVDYRLYVSLPPGYFRSDARVPAVYLLDADYSFAIARNVVEHLSHRGDLPELILVGIAYGDPLGYKLDRTRDYTPSQVPTGGYGPAVQRVSGGGEAFRRFLAEELVPWVDRTYRTVPGDRAIVGHSYGGLFGTYALLTAPGLFSRYVLVSPSLWYDDGSMFRLERAFAESHRSLPARVALAAGGHENPRMAADMNALAARLAEHAYAGLELDAHVFPDDHHDSIFPTALSRGLRFVFEGR